MANVPAPPADTPTVSDPGAATALAASERWIIRNGIGIQIMETLAVGAFLTALAVELGASNMMIGALAAIPHLSQLAQIPAVYTLERIRNRRRVYQFSGWIARPMMLVIAAAAFLLSGQTALWVILAAFAVRYVAGAFLGCSWNSWMRDLVPDQQMGRVFGRRQKWMIGIGIVFSLAAAAFIDLWKSYLSSPITNGYSIIYALSFLGGLYAVVCAARIQEPAMGPPTEGESLVSKLREPFQEENYRYLIRFLTSWNFAINLAAPFFTVHMLKRMELDLTWVIGFGTLSQIAAFLAVSQWGSIADRFSNKSVIRVCGSLFVLCIFAWTFTTMPDMHRGTIPLLVVIHVVTGVASAGVGLAGGNIALKLAPPGKATAYLAANAMANATAAGTAALLGGVFADLFATWELGLTVQWHDAAHSVAVNALNFSHWDFYFFGATIIGLYALHRLSYVREEGEVDDRAVLSAFVNSASQGLRNLSTVAGLRAASGFPIEAASVDADLVVAKSADPAIAPGPANDASPGRKK